MEKKLKSKSNRREERIRVMSLIYELDIKDSTNLADINISDLSEYQIGVLNAYLENKIKVDQEISNSLEGWTIDTIGKIDLAIIRLCLTEAIYVNDVPFKVAINESIEISKLYADDKSPKFINGLLRQCIEKYI